MIVHVTDGSLKLNINFLEFLKFKDKFRHTSGTCTDKSMQIILDQDSINKPLTFNICLLQLIFHTSVSPNRYLHMHAKVFSIQIFQYLRQTPPRVCTLVLFIIIVILNTRIFI